eukprot:scaffold3188_cov68-Phaeocystis_antarctica.AAC.4
MSNSAYAALVAVLPPRPKQVLNYRWVLETSAGSGQADQRALCSSKLADVQLTTLRPCRVLATPKSGTRTSRPPATRAFGSRRPKARATSLHGGKLGMT